MSKSAAAVVDAETTAAPKLVVALGRGKTGKSTFVRWAAERAFSMGAAPVIADADRTNATLTAFFGDVTRPPSPDGYDVKLWLEATLERQMEEGFSAFLDLGGGDLILKEYAREAQLVPFLESSGVEPVAFHFFGTDRDDLAYLRDVEADGVFAPRRTVLVLNEGATPEGLPPARAFAAVREHEVFLDAVRRGAKVVVMPRLKPMAMALVERHRLTFGDAEKGGVKDGTARLGPFQRQYVILWRRAMEDAFAPVTAWLP